MAVCECDYKRVDVSCTYVRTRARARACVLRMYIQKRTVYTYTTKQCKIETLARRALATGFWHLATPETGSQLP